MERKSYCGFGLGLPPALTRLASARVERMRNFILIFDLDGLLDCRLISLGVSRATVSC
jgi:hypothetical protein